jgi:hypothetical protein
MLRGGIWFAAILAFGCWVLAAQSAQRPQHPSPDVSSRNLVPAKIKRVARAQPYVIPPLPIRKPINDAKAAPEPDVWQQSEVEAAQAHCAAILKTINAVAVPQPPIKQGKCGAPAPIRLVSLGKQHRVNFDPPALTNCDMAGALSQWLEKEVQPFAEKHLGSRIAKLEIMSDYSCRASSGRVHNRLSEHAFADAIDIGSFVTESGRTVSVLDVWGETQRDVVARAEAAKAKAEAASAELAKAKHAAIATASPIPATDKGSTLPLPASRKPPRGPVNLASRLGGPQRGHEKDAAEKTATTLPPAPAPTTPESRFLHDVHTAACQIFGTTLGPEANEDHRNHFHVDMAERKYKKICD